jgi:hypothetical protein
MRTWEDFVEDLISNGRSLKHIHAVCLGTRWWPYRVEIMERARELRKFFKKSKN